MYKCLCCGNETLPVSAEDAIAHICPVCWWENDVFLKSPDEPSDENHRQQDQQRMLADFKCAHGEEGRQVRVLN